ncbi:MAG: hypothetical protein ACOC44_14995 [Promethearchaeia archaeon]
MIEVNLDEFKEFYQDRLNDIYYKEKKKVNKILSSIEENLRDIYLCMDHFIQAGEGKVSSKAERSLNLFTSRVKGSIDEMEIPEEDNINYENLMKLMSSLKSLFSDVSEIARKSLPKFKSEVQSEIKELNYLTRKLGKRQSLLEKFLRKKYASGKISLKDAEDLMKKIPKLYSLKENIENAKRDLNEFEEEYEKYNNKVKTLNEELGELEKNKLFKKLKKRKKEIFRFKLKIKDQLHFKKALKKLKFEINKGDIPVSGVSVRDIDNFLKRPVRNLVNQSKDLRQFSSLLVQVRHVLEENLLNIKNETKEKTIEQINKFFDDKKIQEDVEKLRILKQEVKDLKTEIKKVGLADKVENLKDEISHNSIQLDRAENNLNRKKKDYLRYLARLKKEREIFQNSVERVIEEPIKLSITFSF